MAVARVLALMVALLFPRACQAVREMTNLTLGKTDTECTDSIKLEPSSSDPHRKQLQAMFDGKRESKGVLHEGFVKTEDSKTFVLDGKEYEDEETAMTEKCSKYDVCLLMRQLDMEFYQRARLGKLVDEDFKTPPTLMPITRGNCFYEPNKVSKLIANDKSKLGVAQEPGKRGKLWVGQRFDKGFRMRELQSAKACSRRLGGITVETVEREDRPRGCYYSRVPGKDTKPSKAYFNKIQTEVEAGIIEEKDPKAGTYAQAKRTEYVQVCEMDRSLSSAAAAYYSPYKLKENMWNPPDNQRAKMSTSCSFGMMSHLAKERRTQSACAKLLATLEWEDSELKRKLMQVIANNWCPDVWIESTQGDRTCMATRAMSWAYGFNDAEESQRAESLKDFEQEMESQRPPKQALTEETCDWYLENGADQTLASLL